MKFQLITYFKSKSSYESLKWQNLVCGRPSCKFGHKMASTLSTFISLKVLSCMPNSKVTKILMQEEQHASVGE